MTISLGFTAAEIREFVGEYQRVRYGQKSSWLAQREVSYHTLTRWRAAVFGGDLDRGLIPREGSPMSIPPSKRTAYESARAAERQAHIAEVARLEARVRELEGTNDALGKAIGLLHVLNVEEPAETQTITDPPSS